MRVLVFALLVAVVAAVPEATGGAAKWSAQLAYEPNEGPGNIGFTRFAKIQQDPVKKEWESLGSSYSIEFSFLWRKPSTGGALGAWDPVLSPQANETQFVPLVTRHPGQGFNNEWATFHVQLTRTQRGAAVVAWSGCGCAVPPAIVNNEQPSLQTCGFGYLLFSDHPNTLNGQYFVTPDKWTHVAITFDGDGSPADRLKTRTARLYVDGVLRMTNTWNHPDNNPTRFNVCEGREMPYKLVSGFNDEIRLGYLDNQDHPTRLDESGNSRGEFEVYGANAKIDEVRVWHGARSDQQIQENWDLSHATIGDADALLVGYYDWNGGPVSMCSAANSVGGGTPLVEFVDSPNSPGCLFGFDNSQPGYLSVNDRITVHAKRPETLVPVFTHFVLPGFYDLPAAPAPATPAANASSFEPFVFKITGLSTRLAASVATGDVKITTNGNVAVTPSSIQGLVINSGVNVTLESRCSDAECSNLADANPRNPRQFFFEYAARNSEQAPQVSPPATIFFKFVPECRGSFDACGVCNGRNETCQCVVYHNFRNTRMAHTLLAHMLDYLDEKIDNTVGLMQETLMLLQRPQFKPDSIATQLDTQVHDLMSFFNGCLDTYCKSVAEFNGLIAKFSSQTKRELASSSFVDVPDNLEQLVGGALRS